jgi:hypothetical protein
MEATTSKRLAWWIQIGIRKYVKYADQFPQDLDSSACGLC